ncbi:MAG TPA: hypothetical protein VK908_09540 [Jiangellales bacterium]|nr:hypothetical protein [Jiangellales bacterium]
MYAPRPRSLAAIGRLVSRYWQAWHSSLQAPSIAQPTNGWSVVPQLRDYPTRGYR